jgi:hypothetical protein
VQPHAAPFVPAPDPDPDERCNVSKPLAKQGIEFEFTL